MTSPFEIFAMTVVAGNYDKVMEYAPDEQVERVVKALNHFAKTSPLTTVRDRVIDLAGFGQVPVHFESADTRYILLSQAASQLGMTPWSACLWAEREYAWALKDQREIDEERGDGQLGYDLLRAHVDLKVWFVDDDPEARPDAGGHRYSDYGDWLISHDRIMSLILSSPWSKEFMDNTMDAFSYGMKKALGEKVKTLHAFHADGTPATGVELFHSDISEEEALKKARRGPHLDLEGGAL